MADQPKISDDERKEGNRTEAPTGEGNRDTEPEEDVIPHSAKAMSDYHDGLKDLTAACEHHHGEFLKEMKKHHGAMEHMSVRKHYGNWLEEHEKSMNDMVSCHKELLDDMQKKFKKFHPDLEPLEKDADDTDMAKEDDATKEPRQNRSERSDVSSHRDTKTQPATAPEVPVAAPVPAVETKATPADPDELSEQELEAMLVHVGQIKKEAKRLRQDFSKAVG